MTNICMYICAMISGNLRNLQIVQHNELCEDVPKRVQRAGSGSWTNHIPFVHLVVFLHNARLFIHNSRPLKVIFLARSVRGLLEVIKP